MDHNPHEMINICCHKCLITVTRRKAISIVGRSLVAICVVGFISCLITAMLNKSITADIDDSLMSLNETDLNDYDLQTRETLLVSIEQISREQFSSDKHKKYHVHMN